MTAVFVDPRLRSASDLVPYPDRAAVFVACPAARKVLVVDVAELEGQVRYEVSTGSVEPLALAWYKPFLSVWSRDAAVVYRLNDTWPSPTLAPVVTAAWSDAWRGQQVSAAATTTMMVGLSETGLKCFPFTADRTSVLPMQTLPYQASPSSILTSVDRFPVLCETSGVGSFIDLDASRCPTFVQRFPAFHTEGPLAARNIGNGFVVGSVSTNIISVFLWEGMYRADEPPAHVLSSDTYRALRVPERYRVTEQASIVSYLFSRPVRGQPQVDTLYGGRHFPEHAWEESPIADFVPLPTATFRAREPSDAILVRDGFVVRYRVGSMVSQYRWSVLRRKVWTWPVTKAVVVAGTGLVLLHGDDGAVSWRHSIYAYADD